MGIKVINITDADYPGSLKNIFDPPKTLYTIGQLSLVNRAVAVVGSRKMSLRGETITKSVVIGLVKQGYTIISGMAQGVDAAAHWAAINNCGKTIAVLGTGVDIVYPEINRSLYNKIIETGNTVLSEVPNGSYVIKSKFPARNRIISGLSEAVIVIEAQLKSGSLITARLALEQGREVYAVPGSPGCNYLLDAGAANAEELIIPL